MSQVIHGAGKFTAPSAISDLDSQMVKVRKAKTDWSTFLSKVNAGALDHATVPNHVSHSRRFSIKLQ